LAAIFSRTDLIQKKKRPNAYRQTKIFGRQWRPEISRPDVISRLFYFYVIYQIPINANHHVIPYGTASFMFPDILAFMIYILT
jgi:hypothetical protein